MKKNHLKLAAVLLTAPFIAILFTNHWTASAQQQPPPQTPQGPTAGERFKNIKVLNDMPADQLGKVMNIISASLGVKCSFCHVEDDFSKDDKRAKQTARAMMRMTFDINKNNFNGRPQVSCNTCHRGNEEPTNGPDLNPAPEPERPAQPTTKPTADQIIDKYITALGGAAKLGAVKTRYIKANRVEPGGKVIEPETIWFDNNKYSLSTVYSQGPVTEAYNGTDAWKAGPRGAIRLLPDQAEQIKREAELFDPSDLKSIYSRIDYRITDVIDGKQVYLLTANTANGTRERLYFDVQTGLLVRRMVTTPTVLGSYVYQVDYKDYKPFGGVKVPTTIEYAMPGVRWTRKVTQVKNNVPVDAGKFDAPATTGKG
jgi:hypothetical protein